MSLTQQNYTKSTLSNSRKSAKKIKLSYPSFETNVSGPGTVPYTWEHCDKEEHSPPDTQNNFNTFFGVTHKASQGYNFVSMVAREDGSTECIWQNLKSPLIAGIKYSLQVDLAMSDKMESKINPYQEVKKFDQPLVLKINGKNSKENRQHTLTTSSEINHIEWKTYNFNFIPEFDCDQLFFEAQFSDSSVFVNGNILIDNFSHIVRMK